MSDLDEYRNVRPVSSDEVRAITRKEWWVERYLADAAIAELSAEANRWCEDWGDAQKRIAELEAELTKMTKAHNDMFNNWEQASGEAYKAEAELAALKGRRCETCKRFGICEVNRALWSEFHEIEIACNRWAEREKP